MRSGEMHMKTGKVMYSDRDVPWRGETICCTSTMPFRMPRANAKQHENMFSQKTGCLRDAEVEKKRSMSMMTTTIVVRGVRSRIMLIPGRMAAT